MVYPSVAAQKEGGPAVCHGSPAPIDVYWLEQRAVDVPAGNEWLSLQELGCLKRMRFPKRRSDWRLGRWTAKLAVAARLNLPVDFDSLAKIEVRAAASGAPLVHFEGQPAPISISISHRAGVALCTVGPPEDSLGCDLETVEPRSAAFIEDYFTVEEKALIGQAETTERPQLVTLLWSAKESTLKSLRLGLRVDTQCVCASPVNAEGKPEARKARDSFPRPRLPDLDGWQPLQTVYESGQCFAGWWRVNDGLLRTIVSAVPMRTPIRVRANAAKEERAGTVSF